MKNKILDSLKQIQAIATPVADNLRTTVKKNMESILESKGVKLSPADLAALLEDLTPEGSRAALSYALEFVHPFVFGLGLRISHLTDEKIEIVIPDRIKNKNDQGNIHEAAMLASAVEAFHVLWQRHAPLGSFSIASKSSQIEIVKPTSSSIRLRMEITEKDREEILFQLRNQGKSLQTVQVHFFDDADQVVAEISLVSDLRWTQTIGQETLNQTEEAGKKDGSH